MINSFATRTRFYDFIGYLFPGQVIIVIGWLYALWINSNLAWRVAYYAQKIWPIVLVVVFLAVAYALGHAVNSASKIILEKCILKKCYQVRADWLARALVDKSPRGKLLLKKFEQRFGYQLESYVGFELVCWCDEYIPNAAITGSRFLSFYGFCRSMVLLTFFGMIPTIGMIVKRQGWCWLVLLCFVVFATFIFLFCYQYLRFVREYADFNASTLLVDSKEGDYV